MKDPLKLIRDMNDEVSAAASNASSYAILSRLQHDPALAVKFEHYRDELLELVRRYDIILREKDACPEAELEPRV